MTPKSTSRAGVPRLGSRGPKPGTGGRPKKYATDKSLNVYVNPAVGQRIADLADRVDVSAYEYAQDILGQAKDLDDAFPIPVLLGLASEDVAALPDYARAWANEEPDERQFDSEGELIQTYLRSLINADITRRHII